MIFLGRDFFERSDAYAVMDDFDVLKTQPHEVFLCGRRDSDSWNLPVRLQEPWFKHVVTEEAQRKGGFIVPNLLSQLVYDSEHSLTLSHPLNPKRQNLDLVYEHVKVG